MIAYLFCGSRYISFAKEIILLRFLPRLEQCQADAHIHFLLPVVQLLPGQQPGRLRVMLLRRPLHPYLADEAAQQLAGLGGVSGHEGILSLPSGLLPAVTAQVPAEVALPLKAFMLVLVLPEVALAPFLAQELTPAEGAEDLALFRVDQVDKWHGGIVPRLVLNPASHQSVILYLSLDKLAESSEDVLIYPLVPAFGHVGKLRTKSRGYPLDSFYLIESIKTIKFICHPLGDLFDRSSLH